MHCALLLCQKVNYHGICPFYWFHHLRILRSFSRNFTIFFTQAFVLISERNIYCCVAKPLKRHVTVNSTTIWWNCHLLSDNWFQVSLYSANPYIKKNEWSCPQTCHWLSKCQMCPSLSCWDKWQAWGRVILRLLSFPCKKKKKSQIPHGRQSLPGWSQSWCFIHRKTGS